MSIFICLMFPLFYTLDEHVLRNEMSVCTFCCCRLSFACFAVFWSLFFLVPEIKYVIFIYSLKNKNELHDNELKMKLHNHNKCYTSGGNSADALHSHLYVYAYTHYTYHD